MYIVFWGTSSFDSVLKLSSLNGSSGFILNGVTLSEQAGYSVSLSGGLLMVMVRMRWFCWSVHYFSGRQAWYRASVYSIWRLFF